MTNLGILRELLTPGHIAVGVLALLMGSGITAWLRRCTPVPAAGVVGWGPTTAIPLGTMESLIDGTPHPIYVRDRDGRMVTCNANYLKVFATSRAAVMGQTALEGVKRDRREAQEFHDDYLWVVANGIPLEKDRTLHLPGRTLSVYHWIQPYRDGSGEIAGVVCGWVDVSERHQLMEELTAALEAAAASNHDKTKFLATLSHEIRTPINAIVGMLELARLHAAQGQPIEAGLKGAHEAALGLIELVGDVLDLVRAESGHLSLRPKQASLHELTLSVTRMFDGLARQKGLRLEVALAADTDHEVLVDTTRFKQLLFNVLGNAIKFTEHGSIQVRLSGTQPEAARMQIRLEVIDTGIGIDAASLVRLFEPFVQGEHGTAREGTGLGLPICKVLCERMGGDIAVSSRPGEGTCVTLRLPLEVLEPADGQPAAPPRPHVQLALRKWRILVVDDRPANRVLLVEQLSFLGQTVVSAQNGEEALALWRTDRFDMVITDCCMPVMDGYTLSRRIREDERARGASPCAVIGYTANVLPEERIRCLDAGMDDCLFKPLTLSALSSRLASLQGSDMADEGTTGAVDGSMMAMVRALTGDDDRLACVFLDEAIDSFRHDLAAVLAWREDPQVPALAALAHGIKGGARMVDADEVVHACERVEQACQYPLHPQLLETAVAELAARLETTTAQAIALREVLCDGRCPAAA